MGAGTAAAVCLICCFMVAPFTLQTVGFFTPKWASISTCDSLGLVYSCCYGEDNDTCDNMGGGNELDVRALGLEATSFAIMFLTVFFLCCGICCTDDEDDVGWCAALGGCCFLLFPVAGLFSIIGCILVATQFATSDLGYSFILCLTSGCFVVFVTLVSCCCLCKSMKEDSWSRSSTPLPPPTSPTPPRVSHTNESQAVYPYGGQQQVTPSYGGEASYMAQHASVEEAVAVHDHESGRLMVFMRKINFTRLVARVGHFDD